METKKLTLEPGYKNFSEFLFSKDKYKDLEDLLENEVHGAEWKIYKYEDIDKPGQYLAYKTLFENITNFKKFYVQLFRELDITNRARHPCTMEFISFDLSDIEQPVIVNRYYENGSLDDVLGDMTPEGYIKFNSKYAKWGNMTSNPANSRLKNSKIEIERGTDYTILLYGIARGIQYLHKHNIFHRDLKPANIVIDENRRPHIADFGYSKIAEEGVEQSNTYGTLLFMAPEAMRGKDFSFPADIYSLGIIFYILTELEIYIPGKLSLGKKFNNYKKKLLNGIPFNFEMRESNKHRGLILRMLSLNPLHRPKIDEICEHLEKKENWFENTNETTFTIYKEEIDDFESKQNPLITDNIQISNKSSNKKGKNKKEGKKVSSTTKKASTDNDNIYDNIQRLLKKCSNSNSEAECALGSIFYTGYKGIPKDYVSALRYFKESKKHGNPQARIFIQNILNEIIKYERGNENEHFLDPTLNIEDENDPIFAKIRDKRSQLIYGMVQESNNNYERSMNLYLRSCKQGSQEAKSRLGILLLKTNTFLDKSEKLLEETSRWGKEEKNDKKYIINDDERKLSLLNLGILKLNKNDIDESIKIFEQLYKEDHPDATLLLGISYEMKGDNSKALEYYEKSDTEFSNESSSILSDYLKSLTTETSDQ